jgi:hypothetical protein
MPRPRPPTSRSRARLRLMTASLPAPHYPRAGPQAPPPWRWAFSLAEIQTRLACGAEWETWKVNRAYYSQRIGRGPLANPTIEDVARVLTLTVDEMQRRDYLQEWHGLTCAYAGEIDGRAGGVSLADHIEAETGWRSAWPLADPLFDGLELVEGTSIPDSQWEKMEQNSEDMLFDLIEYFHRHVSEGIEGSDFHMAEGFPCGWHYGAFDPAPAQAMFRERMNGTLVRQPHLLP